MHPPHTTIISLTAVCAAGVPTNVPALVLATDWGGGGTGAGVDAGITDEIRASHVPFSLENSLMVS